MLYDLEEDFPHSSCGLAVVVLIGLILVWKAVNVPLHFLADYQLRTN